MLINEFDGIDDKLTLIDAISDIMSSVNPDAALHKDTLPVMGELINEAAAEIKRRLNLIYMENLTVTGKRTAKAYSKD